MTRLRFIVLYVRDVRAELSFYERAFGFERRHLDAEENGAYGELSTGETVVAFALHELVGRHRPIAFRSHDLTKRPAGFELTLALDALDDGIERALECGATLVVPPKLKAWGPACCVYPRPSGAPGGPDRPPVRVALDG